MHTLTVQSCFVALCTFVIYVQAQFVATSGMHFQVDGKPYSFAGANYWPLAMTTSNDILRTIDSAKSQNFAVLRMAAWNIKDPNHGLNPGYVFLQSWDNGKSSINDGATGLQLLDEAVKAAEAANIKLIMCLTNNWNNYGGMDTFNQNVLGPSAPHSAFYTDPTIISAFKDYVSTIVSRYSSSSAIFSWELANEARCQQDPACSGSSTLTNWADQISQYIKSLDPNHLVAFGGNGFFNEPPPPGGAYDFQYDGDSGEDYAAILALKGIDYGTVHSYVDTLTAESEKYTMDWFQHHNDVSAQVGKPMVIAELGVTRNSPTEVTQSSILSTLEKWMLDPQQAPAVQGMLFWSVDLTGGQCPLGGDPYAMCQNDPDRFSLVGDFNRDMAGKATNGGSAKFRYR